MLHFSILKYKGAGQIMLWLDFDVPCDYYRCSTAPYISAYDVSFP